MTAVLYFSSYCKKRSYHVTYLKKAVDIASFFMIFHLHLIQQSCIQHLHFGKGWRENKIIKTFTKGIDEIKTQVGFQVTYF